jgi:signal transduction histidine kinase/ActR/RegA family two-component response regulator
LVARNDGKFGQHVIPSEITDLPLNSFAPRLDWSLMSETEHFVQLYENHGYLIESLGGFVGSGLRNGDPCIVVATKPHRDELEDLLQASGLDVRAEIMSGRYVPLDASETLSSFMIDGQPSLELFNSVIGGLIAGNSNGRPLRVFGEMVALLWSSGNFAASIRLEELWNDLQQKHRFSLFCAYPIDGFAGEALESPLSHVCATHTRVLPTESFTSLTDTDERLRAIIRLQQKARSLEAEIAERKAVEDALRRVKDELEMLLTREQMARADAEEANRLKDDFLATVSHELRTPLNAIIGWSHMIRQGGLDEETVSRAIATIERNAKSQAQLVEDILDVSRVISGKLRLHIEPVDIASVINAAIDSVQLAADSKSIRLAVTLDPSARHVSGDSNRLQQVVWNLLSNAIKFTPPGGRVDVRLERADSSVRLTVNDSGPGIEPEFLPFIFDRFRQADGTSTRRHGGLGLGLSIVRHLVELHGGTVKADSPGEGSGATFTITLPLPPDFDPSQKRRRGVKPHSQKKKEAPQLITVASLDGIKVLLVDDDSDSLQMLSLILGEYRAIVQTAESVADALDALQWFGPHVIVSDLAMPDEDGCDLISRIRSGGAGEQIPAVALTALVRVEDRARALSAGFNMFVPKPVEPNELITAIANLTDAGTIEIPGR